MLEIEKVFGESPHGRVVVTYRQNATDVPLPFAFVLNISRLIGGNSIEISHGLILRRAKTEEIKFVKEIMKSVFGSQFTGTLWEDRPPKSGRGAYVKLPAKQWRYFVIEIGDHIEELADLEIAFTIAECDLELGLVASKMKIANRSFPVCTYRPPQLFQSLSALSSRQHSEEGVGKILSKADAEHLGQVYAKLRRYDRNILDLAPVFKQLLELKDLPYFSPLQILGYFAILESILTHQPNPEDRYDSITRQITRKLALLDKRWSPHLDYSAFGSATHEKIWSKMYAYRSAIAHGATPDFQSHLSLLRNKGDANGLLKSTVKQVIRHCLVEPQLIADLHNC